MRRDLPKELFSYLIIAPNFGDYSNGSHTVLMTRQRYVRQYEQPYKTMIDVSIVRENQDSYILRFTSKEVLTKNNSNFQDRLLANCNIFQELFGGCDVKASNEDYPTYHNTLKVNWEILHQGTREQQINTIIDSSLKMNERQKELIKRN